MFFLNWSYLYLYIYTLLGTNNYLGQRFVFCVFRMFFVFPASVGFWLLLAFWLLLVFGFHERTIPKKTRKTHQKPKEIITSRLVFTHSLPVYRGLGVTEYTISQPSLEQVFLRFAKEQHEADRAAETAESEKAMNPVAKE